MYGTLEKLVGGPVVQMSLPYITGNLIFVYDQYICPILHCVLVSCWYIISKFFQYCAGLLVSPMVKVGLPLFVTVYNFLGSVGAELPAVRRNADSAAKAL